LDNLSIPGFLLQIPWIAATMSENKAMETTSSAQVQREQSDYGNTPLVILTGQNTRITQAQWRIWNEMHETIARLAVGGVHVVVPNAGHSIPLDQPSVVTSAVAEVVSSAHRGGTR
jgi:pimeloyl-ACP methyl ester carboxylesterase